MADCLDEAIRKACHIFGVADLFPDQKRSLKEFISGKDIFVNLPTGYGKSIIFQMAPIVHEELATTPGKPILIVVSPLSSLMEDQKSYLKSLGITVGAIGDDKDENTAIEKGQMSIVLTSPESLLGNMKWRKMLTSEVYAKNLIGVVVDEAHCISHW